MRDNINRDEGINGKSYELNTYENGRPKFSILFSALLKFLFFSLFAFLGLRIYYGDIIIINQSGIMTVLSYVLIALGALLLLAGIYQLLPKKVRVDKMGIKVERRGNEVFKARWGELKSVRADHYFDFTRFMPIGNRFAIRTSQGILLEKQNSKYKLLESKYEKEKLQDIFEFIAAKSSTTGIQIIDNLDWLDEDGYDDLSSSDEQIKSTKEKRLDLVIRIGEISLLIGSIFSGISYFIEVPEIFLMIGIIGLFLGIFITVIGLAGKSELD